MRHKEKKIISLALSPEIYEKIDALARDSYRTRPGYIRQIIKLYIHHLEQPQEEEDWWTIK